MPRLVVVVNEEAEADEPLARGVLPSSVIEHFLKLESFPISHVKCTLIDPLATHLCNIQGKQIRWHLASRLLRISKEHSLPRQ